ncbi:MAG TPA: alanine--tRNA ligase, partial [Pseudolabrys sp.]|nr:alanine--tRNA ligase [Pseudolabrys sp.]
DTGPCGPCAEIFYDHGAHIPGGPPGSAEADGDRFIEIWNLVFMQFEQQEGGKRVPLPRPSIDTGMGLERIAAVLQGTHDNYAIDLFATLIRNIAEETGVDSDGPHKASHRVIADHLRASSFLIADGVLPSNEGRGYVLRRIMRRAMRHAELLGAKEPLMWKLVHALVREMGQAYPELVRAEALISETLKLEEARFRQMLSKGLALLDDKSAGLKKGAMFDGETAFTLYDTYGFPLDLTQDALRSRGISVDLASFEDAMERQREKARAAWVGSGDAKTADYWFPLREKYGTTEFLGYETLSSEAVVKAIIKGGPELNELRPEHRGGEVIVNQTPFYAESGGQVSDTGWIRRVPDGTPVARVRAVHKEADGLIVHNVEVTELTLRVGDPVYLDVDPDRRADICRNHSATHLLHEALRQVLGDHVAQKGSLVADDRLRFDFAHHKQISPPELDRIEDKANAIILENAEVKTKIMPVDDAIASGARALFGEKYGDEVRVVSMGKPHGNETAWSVELCGGTHVQRTGDIGLISILTESGVASGVRRIEALTGNAARHHLNKFRNDVRIISAELKAPIGEITVRATAVVEERKKLERELSEVQQKLALSGTSGREDQPDFVIVNGTKLMVIQVKDADPKNLKPLADQAKIKIGSGIVAVANTTSDGRASLVVGVTPDLTSRFNAVDLVRKGAEALGGKGGGGRPDMAQAGGPDGSKADAALKAIEAALGG